MHARVLFLFIVRFIHTPHRPFTLEPPAKFCAMQNNSCASALLFWSVFFLRQKANCSFIFNVGLALRF